ncbi:hypothetical protein ACEQPO_13015 [Bacillus sp. SL00103]
MASKIADRVGITRSVIVNALRKLESAGVIESRSLGMKGTYIKVLNNKFLIELENLNLIKQKPLFSRKIQAEKGFFIKKRICPKNDTLFSKKTLTILSSLNLGLYTYS